ncbi:MAG: hypothetical protein WAN65_01815, partial [Candidatus Sulfotelmatobacter sp.]
DSPGCKSCHWKAVRNAQNVPIQNVRLITSQVRDVHREDDVVQSSSRRNVCDFPDGSASELPHSAAVDRPALVKDYFTAAWLAETCKSAESN